ncbi:SAF domain-containing protein [Kitasatospora sp. NBC_01287]|uniref:SAF domain-containing protein n=1 Tax=Kitasatospora sp. NBC_01287 TaxID=2903573 RepID=UPI002258353B|nr:SAF domain-containing protein [Kitasatospora sp. NBC_01287]MCX4750569.1 SAF domain-containing protein [Kitasatospora sp. NBC_01287]
MKRRDRMRLLAGLAVMAVCALLFGALAIVTGHRSRVLVLARPVAAGQVLTGADVKSVLVSAEAGTATIGAERLDAVVGQRVSASLPAGLLLSDELLGRSVAGPGAAVLALAVKEGRYPPTLDAGDRVAVYEARPEPAAGGAGGGVGVPVEAMVLDVRPGDGSSGGAVVTLQASAESAGGLVADQEPAVVVLGAGPGGGGR